MCKRGLAGVAVAQAGIGAISATEQAPLTTSCMLGKNAYNQIGSTCTRLPHSKTKWNKDFKIWNQRLAQYDKQVKRNYDCCYGYGGAYMGLQQRTNEKFLRLLSSLKLSLTSSTPGAIYCSSYWSDR